MKANPGYELTCMAHVMKVVVNGLPVHRSIISYYATLTMGEATDMQSWVKRIAQKSSKDLKQHKIHDFHKPALQICGDPSVAVVGGMGHPEIADGA